MTRSFLTLIALGTSLNVYAAGADKVDICHWDEDTQTYEVLNISVNAVHAHFKNHDDHEPGTWYVDADGDGYGDAGEATDQCPQIGLVDNGDDCDDTDSAVNPGVEETPYNGIDDDCNPDTPDDDLDNDGYGIAEDCDDTRSDVNPGMDETPYNGLDDDCDESTPDDDLDYDGYGIAEDCDDLEELTNPGAEEVCGDGIDNDCDNEVDEECDVCPCFTSDEIAWQLERTEDWDSTSHYCLDYTYSSVDYSMTYLVLNASDSDADGGARLVQRYMGRGYDTDYGWNYCETYNIYDYEYEYGSGYTRYVPRSIERLYITAEERNACEDILIDATEAAGMECRVVER